MGIATRYKNMWFDYPTRAPQRAQYGDSPEGRKKYFRYVRYLANQEIGMKAFGVLERRELRRMRWQTYYSTGEAKMQSFMAALASRQEMTTAENDFVFASIDVEGKTGMRTGVTNFGIATLDTRSWLLGSTTESAKDMEFRATNFGTCTSKNKARNLWARGVPISRPDELRDCILDSVRITDDDIHVRGCGGEVEVASPLPLRKIVLVGHGISNDINELEESLDIAVEAELPMVVGFIDTCKMAQVVMGKNTRLNQLLDLVSILWTPGSFHGAANDAHYALRAALAMAAIQFESSSCMEETETLDRFDRIIKQPSPKPGRRDGDVSGQCVDLDTFEGDMFAFMDRGRE